MASKRLERTAPVGDYARMTNGEIAEVVREKLRESDADAYGLVEIDVQDGRVFLRGEVPSEAQQQLATKIVKDEIGFEVVDELRVTQALWTKGEDEPDRQVDRGFEREVDERAQGITPGETTDDIYRVDEDSLVFVPPTRPPPEDDER